MKGAETCPTDSGGRCWPLSIPPSQLMVPFDFWGWPLLKDQFRLAVIKSSVRFRLALPTAPIFLDETLPRPRSRLTATDGVFSSWARDLNDCYIEVGRSVCDGFHHWKFRGPGRVFVQHAAQATCTLMRRSILFRVPPRLARPPQLATRKLN